MRKFSLVPIIIVLLIGFVGGLLSSPLLFKKKSTAITPAVRQSGYKFINPLLECELYPDGDNTELKPFRYKIDDLINQKMKGGYITHVSMYFRDLNNGPWIGVNEKENFSPASLLKVPIMMSYLKEAETHPEILTKKILFEPSSEEGQFSQVVTPPDALEKGKEYTSENLLFRMIAYSDNAADRMLFYNINQDALNRTYQDLSIDVPNVRKPEDFMNVKTYASFFRMLYNASYLNRTMSEKALEILSKSTYTNGLAKGIPVQVAVAHKFGERFLEDGRIKQLHDCGIIYYPNYPYLLCVMTRGKDFKSLETTIADISSLVYKEVEGQKKQ